MADAPIGARVAMSILLVGDVGVGWGLRGVICTDTEVALSMTWLLREIASLVVTAVHAFVPC